MGMAASQARFIELAARKNNVEYEGQQINQQRTALANESAGLFNKMLQLEVPTAPNYNQFVKTIYTFSDGTNDYTIDSFARVTDNPSYNAKVNYYYTVTEYTGMYKERSDLDLAWHKGVEGSILYYGTKKLDNYDAKVDEAAVRQIYEDTKKNKETHPIMDGDTLNASLVGINYEKYLELHQQYEASAKTQADYDNFEKPALAELNKIKSYQSGGTTYYISTDEMTSDTVETIGQKTFSIKDGDTIKVYSYISDDPSAYASEKAIGTYDTASGIAVKEGVTYSVYTNTFDKETGDLTTKITSNDTFTSQSYSVTTKSGTNQPVQNCYAKDLTQKKWLKEVNAYLDRDDSGNYKSITLENYSNTFDMDVYQETDDAAYNQAMNDYVYQKATYDKEIADVNAKTEIIQQEDRTLELKLKQLDTEHNALQTEMEAVKKVCDKNVEDTFKTFN